MSALWSRLVITFCLICSALSGEESGIQWRDVGESISIHCRFSGSSKTSFSLLKGLNSNEKVLYKERSGKNTVAQRFSGRLELEGVFPNLNLKIANLTAEDTGPYWCVYSEFDTTAVKLIDSNGDGSVLLVVTDKRPCEPPSGSLLLVSVVTSVAVFFILLMACSIGVFLKARCAGRAAKLRGGASPAGNDVYEDMRSTIRR